MSDLLTRLRARLREKSDVLEALQTKAFGDESTPEDIAALEAAVKECEEINTKIDLAEKAEGVQAKASAPANVVIRPDATQRVPAAVDEKMELGQKLSLTAAAIIKAGKGGNPLQVLADEGYAAFAQELKDYELRSNKGHTTKAINTLTDSEGGVLVPTPLNGGIIPLLRVQSTFLAADPTRVQLINGQFNQPRGATGATAAYVAEGALKPVSTPTFDAIAMQAKKLAGIVPLTREARMWTVGNIEQYVRDDLRNVLALTMDLNAFLGTGAGASPTGILNKASVQTFTGVFSSATAPTLAELDTFATAMILKLVTQNIYNGGRWRWIMSYRSAMKLAAMRVGDNDGDLAFPQMNGGGPGAVWKGIPVIITSQMPTNVGSDTNETTIALVDFADVLFGEEEGIRMAMSDQATLDVDGAGTLIHLWQQNMFAILAESMHDFGLRRATAVVKATGIKW